MPYKGLTFSMVKNMKPAEKDRLLAILINSEISSTDFDAVAADTGSASANSVKTMLFSTIKKCKEAEDPDNIATPTQTPKKGGRKRKTDVVDDAETPTTSQKNGKKLKYESGDFHSPGQSPSKNRNYQSYVKEGSKTPELPGNTHVEVKAEAKD